MRRSVTLFIFALSVSTMAHAQATPTRTPPSASAPTPTPKSRGVTAVGDSFSVDFTDADIRVVITALANAGGLNIAYGDIPAKKTTLHLFRPVARADIPAVLRSVAISNGLRITEDNGMITIGTTGPSQQAARRPTFAGTELHIYQLKHANATRLSQVLQGIFSNSNVRVAGVGNAPGVTQQLQGRNAGRRGGGITGGAGGGGNGQGISAGRFNAEGDAFRINAIPGNPYQNLAAMINGAQPGDATQMVIVPDETTNSLIIRAAPNDWEVIQQAIEGIDIRPRQVLIEVMIAEVTRNDDFSLGIKASASNARTTKGAKVTGGIQSVTDTTAGLIARFSSQGAVDVNVALSALQTRGNVRVLSLPLILAQNNHESVLFVGSRYPFVSSARLLDNNTNAVDQTVTYQDIGTTLDILPTINPDGYVNLQVYQEVSAATSLLSSQSTSIQAPVFTNRNALASVFVKNGQTVVVGGLTDRSETKVRSGIPLLSQIPLIGGLFGSTTNSTARTELYLFLTPHMVMSDADANHAREQITKHSELMHAIPVDSIRVIDPQTELIGPDSDIDVLPDSGSRSQRDEQRPVVSPATESRAPRTRSRMRPSSSAPPEPTSSIPAPGSPAPEEAPATPPDPATMPGEPLTAPAEPVPDSVPNRD